MFWVVLVAFFIIIYITFTICTFTLMMVETLNFHIFLFFLNTFGLNSDINHSDHSSFLKGRDILT